MNTVHNTLNYLVYLMHNTIEDTHNLFVSLTRGVLSNTHNMLVISAKTNLKYRHWYLAKGKNVLYMVLVVRTVEEYSTD